MQVDAHGRAYAAYSPANYGKFYDVDQNAGARYVGSERSGFAQPLTHVLVHVQRRNPPVGVFALDCGDGRAHVARVEHSGRFGRAAPGSPRRQGMRSPRATLPRHRGRARALRGLDRGGNAGQVAAGAGPLVIFKQVCTLSTQPLSLTQSLQTSVSLKVSRLQSHSKSPDFSLTQSLQTSVSLKVSRLQSLPSNLQTSNSD